jgi:hypothetical protein
VVVSWSEGELDRAKLNAGLDGAVDLPKLDAAASTG